MRPRLVRDARGVVMLEAVIAFLPVLVMFLGAVQIGLLGAARLVVQHAAVAGARAAAVVLDDDPARYGGAARGDLSAGSAASADRSALEPFASLELASVPADGARLAAIRRAVALPLAALDPRPAAATPEPSPAERPEGPPPSVAAALGDAGASRLARALGALAATTTLEISTDAGPSEGGPGRAELADTVTVRVTFRAPCMVPIARVLICDERSDGFAKTLTGRATMPRFGARYSYPSERVEDAS